jgi:biopolymer transport protein ExbB
VRLRLKRYGATRCNASQTISAKGTQAASAALRVITDVKSTGTGHAKNAAESTDNPYGWESLWKTSDGVAKTVFAPAAHLSIGGLHILSVPKTLQPLSVLRFHRF